MISTKEYTSMHACAAALRTETEELHTERKTTQTTDENVRTKKKNSKRTYILNKMDKIANAKYAP